MGRPELAATPPVPTAMVPLKYPVDVLAAVIADVGLSAAVVVPVGATAGSPLTGLTAMRGLSLDDDAAAAGIGLKRMLGTTVVERPVDDEALSMMVLTTVFCTVV